MFSGMKTADGGLSLDTRCAADGLNSFTARAVLEELKELKELAETRRH